MRKKQTENGDNSVKNFFSKVNQVIYTLSRVHVHNLHSGVNLHPLASRSYANKSCSYVPRFDSKFNKRYTVLWSNSLCLNVLCDSDHSSLRVMCVRDISIAGCGVETFTFHSYKSQKSINTHITGNKNVRHDCISIDELP